MTTEEKAFVDDLIRKALQVQTDEIEGQQVIDIDTLNLCAVDYDESTKIELPDISEEDIIQSVYSNEDLMKILLSDPEDIPDVLSDIPSNENVILEFSEGTVKNPDPVIYDITVSPGEQINESTIIGQVEQEGKQKQIKSIFSEGEICGNEDNSDFFHLYPSSCNRHIVIKNAKPESGGDYDLTLNIENLTESFKNEGILYALITNNMCQSMLPFVLSRRYRGSIDQSGLNKNQKYSDTFIKSRLNSSDFAADNTEFSQEYINIYNEDSNGLKIYDSSILKVVDKLQEEFASKIIAEDVTPETMRDWKKRLKKKRKRKKAKKEITEKVQSQTDKIKQSENPYNKINEEKDRLLSVREKYINGILDIYRNRDKIPRCRYDAKYTDCKFLVNDSIDGEVLKEVKKYDDEFTYSGVGETEEYYNYYFSLLANINLSDKNEYTDEYYQIITDIINKRIIVESTELKDIKLNFCKLFNDNVYPIFNVNNPFGRYTENYIDSLFGKFDNQVNSFVMKENIKFANNIEQEFTDKGLDEEAVYNAGELYTSDNQYKMIYDYIKTLFPADNDEDETACDLIAAQLATMYTYIKSYGDGSNNIYKDLKTEDDKYLYYKLINEEAEKIMTFWDKVVALYENNDLNSCIRQLYEISGQYKDYATWPLPTELTINNVTYKHYLFENIPPKDDTGPVDISIGDYAFPDKVTPPEIPEEIDVDEDEALEKMLEHELTEPTYDPVTILDFKYWQKYFALATLICLVPAFWNCGLDIMPWIQLIYLPCIFIAIDCVYIPFFNLLIVFGIAIRGMYPWPIILYLNTSDQPASILTPLIGILNNLRLALRQQLQNIQDIPIQQLVNLYINKLQNESNQLKKENKKLDAYSNNLKNVRVPKVESIRKEFSQIVDPYIDTRQRITRLDQLAKKQRVSMYGIDRLVH